MSNKQVTPRKHRAKVSDSALARGTASHIPTKHRSLFSNALSGLDDLDEETLLTLCTDAPVRLTPSPKNDPLTSESPQAPFSKTRVSDKVMEATLERLGFGPPNDLPNPPISPTPTPANSETSNVATSDHEEIVPIIEEPVPAIEASGTDDSDAYDQIKGLFQQIARRTGHSVNSLILEWALLHAHTDMVKRRVTHGHMSSATTARQQAFEEEVNKIIELGTGLADVGIDFMFVMVGQSATEDVSLGKIWSTPGLQEMFKDLSLSNDKILAAARMHSYSSMWSRFCNKYKQGQAERAEQPDDKTAATIAPADMSSYISKQSAAAASAFLNAPHKKGGIEKPAEGGLSPVSKGGSSSVITSSDSGSFHVPKPIKRERSALSVLQDVLLGRD